MAESTPPQPEPFDWNSLPEPQAIDLPLYPEDSPARKDEESTMAFNEAGARAAFGDACIDRLMNEQKMFRGDWWMLAMLLRCEAHAEKIDPTRESRGRFGSLSRIRSSLREQGMGLHLEGVKLSRANFFKYADFRYSHLEYANLGWAHLEYANLYRSILDHSTLRRTYLDHAYLTDASLKHAELYATHLEHATLFGTHFEDANLFGANLKYADLREARFERASMDRANFDYALARKATGILFDDTAVERLDIEGNANDPWSVLRRKYTGPMFFVNLLLVVAFVLPYAARVLALTVTGRTHAAMRASLEAGAEAPAGAEMVRAWLEQFDAAHTQAHAWYVLLGGAQPLRWLFVPSALAILAYNALRGFLTLKVGILRDQADRVLRTPTLEEYYGPCHPLARGDAGWRRLWPVWKRSLVRWCKAKNAEQPLRWRFANMTLLNPLNILGLYRLHQIARVLFWISVISVAWHVGWWLLTTTVPVPK